MRKDITRDYATDAFRVWALWGCPSYDDAVAKVRKKAEGCSAGQDPAVVVALSDAEVEKRMPILLDIMACEQTFSLLRKHGKEHICRAVKAVYMTEPHKISTHADITSRVHRFARKLPAHESTIYRYLDEARGLFAAFRGLRIDESCE